MRLDDPSETSPPRTDISYAILPDRMPRIPVEEMTEDQRQAVQSMLDGPRGEVRGPYWPLLRSPGFFHALQHVGDYTRYTCTLNRRISELATMISARHLTQQYVWNTHYGKCIKSGLTQATLDAISEGRRPAGMPEDEEVTYDFLTELLANKGVCDATYERARKVLGEKEIIDIVGIVGYYNLLGMVMNVARTPLRDSRPLPLDFLPVQLRCDIPGKVDATNYVLTKSQDKEF